MTQILNLYSRYGTPESVTYRTIQPNEVTQLLVFLFCLDSFKLGKTLVSSKYFRVLQRTSVKGCLTYFYNLKLSLNKQTLTIQSQIKT